MVLDVFCYVMTVHSKSDVCFEDVIVASSKHAAKYEGAQ